MDVLVNIIYFFVLFAMALCPISCQKRKGNKPCSGPKKENNWLYVNFSVEPPSFDFRKTSCRTTPVLAEMMYEGLMKVGRDGSLIPAQADKVVISPDGLHYTFYLRDTVWSNGTSVTAQDFASAWLENLNPNFPAVYAHLFYCIRNARAAKEGRCPLTDVGIRTEGEKTLIVDLEVPTAYFLCLTTSAWFFPIRLPNEDAKGNLSSGELLSNGPFMLEGWQHAKQICVVKNPRYRCAQEIQLEGIRISLITDENTAAELFEHGDFDLLGLPFSPLPFELAKKLADKNKISPNPIGGVTVCCFNSTRAPFDNPKIRRAFSMAIDRRQLMDVFCPSAYAPAFTLVPSVFLQATGIETIPSRTRAEEIERARRDFEEGLSEKGLDPNTFPKVQLNYHQYKGHTLFQKVAEVIQQDWQDILGVKVELRGFEVHSVIKHMLAKEFDSSLITWSANYQDPMSFLDKFLSPSNPKNYPGWFHPNFNEAIMKANALLDIKKRAECLWQAEKVFQEEAPCAPLFHWSYPLVINPRLKGMHLSPAASIDYTALQIVPHGKNEHRKIVKRSL